MVFFEFILRSHNYSTYQVIGQPTSIIKKSKNCFNVRLRLLNIVCRLQRFFFKTRSLMFVMSSFKFKARNVPKYNDLVLILQKSSRYFYMYENLICVWKYSRRGFKLIILCPIKLHFIHKKKFPTTLLTLFHERVLVAFNSFPWSGHQRVWWLDKGGETYYC